MLEDNKQGINKNQIKKLIESINYLLYFNLISQF